MELISLYKVLKRKWWIILLIPTISIFASYFFTRKIEDVYKSSAQISTGFTEKSQLILGNENLNFRDVEIKFNNLIQNIRSPKVLSLLSYRLILHDLNSPQPFRTLEKSNQEYSISTELIEQVKPIYLHKLDSFEVLSKMNEEDELLNEVLQAYGYDIETLAKSINVWRINFTDYVQIDGKSENTYLSAFMVNTLCSEFIRYYKAFNYNQSRESIEFLESLIDQKNLILQEKRNQLEYYKSTNQILDPTAKSQSNIIQINNYEMARNEEEQNITAFTLQLKNLNDRISSIKNIQNQGNNSQLVELRNKISELNARYIKEGLDNPELLDSINSLRKLYSIEVSRSSGNVSGNDKELLTDLTNKKFDIETQLQISKSNLDNINSRLIQLKSQASSFAGEEIKINELQNSIDIISQEYQSLLDKLNDTKNQAMLGGTNLRQILVGQPADDPEPSKKLILVALSGMASFVFIVVIIIGLEFLDQSIKTGEKLSQTTKLPLVGTLNNIKVKNFELFPIFQNKVKNPEYDAFKQNLRKIRFEIENKGKNIILITSPREKSGKTFFILALSYFLGLINKKVLIIDTNFKNNQLSKLLLKKPIANGNSLKIPPKETTKLLNSSFQRENSAENQQDFFQQYIYKTNLKDVDVIGCKQGDDSPSEIFSNKRFDVFLEQFSKVYDYILLEGASLNEFSDTKELVSYCNGVISIFTANTVINELDKESISFLKNLNGKLIGSILNRIDISELE